MDIKKSFSAVYDETLLFMISLSIALFSIFTPFLSNIIFSFFQRKYSDSETMFFGVIVLAVLASAVILSIYQLISKRDKSSFEKGYMLFLIISINTTAGYLALLLPLLQPGNRTAWMVVFPILNFLMAVSMFISLLLGKIKKSDVSDRNADPKELIIGSAFTATIFLLCQIAFKIDLALSFSIMLGYVMLVHRLVRPFFVKEAA